MPLSIHRPVYMKPMSEVTKHVVLLKTPTARVIAIRPYHGITNFAVETNFPDALGADSWRMPGAELKAHLLRQALEARLTMSERAALGIPGASEEASELQGPFPFTDKELGDLVVDAANRFENLKEDGYILMGKAIAAAILRRVENPKAISVSPESIDGDIKYMAIPLDPERIGFTEQRAPETKEVFLVEVGVEGGTNSVDSVFASATAALDRVTELQKDGQEDPLSWTEERPFHWRGSVFFGKTRYITLSRYPLK